MALTLLDNLIINKLTQEQYNKAVGQGAIQPNQLYLIPDTRNEYTDEEKNKLNSLKLDGINGYLAKFTDTDKMECSSILETDYMTQLSNNLTIYGKIQSGVQTIKPALTIIPQNDTQTALVVEGKTSINGAATLNNATTINGVVTLNNNLTINEGKVSCKATNPYIGMQDTAADSDETQWYLQVHENKLKLGPSISVGNPIEISKNGNLETKGIITGKYFKTDNTPATIQPSNENEINFGSNSNLLYFGYKNRCGSDGTVNTYYFGRGTGNDVNSTDSRDGDIYCGHLHLRRDVVLGDCVNVTYDSTNECLNFVFN